MREGEEEIWAEEKEGGLGEWARDGTGGEERGREEGGRKPCAAVGEGAMGAMKVGGGSEEEGGGEADDLGGREEEEEGGGEGEGRVWVVGGDEAAGRAGVMKEKREAEDGTEGGTAPPGTEGLAAAGGEL